MTTTRSISYFKNITEKEIEKAILKNSKTGKTVDAESVKTAARGLKKILSNLDKIKKEGTLRIYRKPKKGE